MLEFFRHIAHPHSSSVIRVPSRFTVVSARLVISAVVFIFLMDAINVDVIYAALKGDMQYEDNPSVVDSIFDTNSAQYYQASSLTVRVDGWRRQLPQQINTNVIVRGHVVFEDADSPTILECDTTASLIGECFLYPRMNPLTISEVTHTIDRTISFQRLLI